MPDHRVLSVGQCGFDHASISHRLARLGASTVAAHSRREATALIKTAGFDLVLVNRLFDADGDSGIDFIRALKDDPETAETRVMLVSNFPEVQKEAEELGALPGFGKSSLDSAETARRIKAALAASTAKAD